MSPPQINKYYAIDSRPAPKKLGSRKYPPLCPAPGTYVMER
jgi:polyhydroxyalkanoate synthase